MATNEILPFAIGGGANVESQADYSVDTKRTNGNQPGIASSAFNNKAIRQSAFISSQLAQYLANVTGGNVLDDGDTAALLAIMQAGLSKDIAVVTKTANYTATSADYSILCSGSAFTITLPNAVGIKGKTYLITKTDSSLTNIISVASVLSQTIGYSGATTIGLYTLGERFEIYSDGANWQIRIHDCNTDWNVVAGGLKLTAESAYVFTVTSANATIGAVYSNNGFLYNVTTSISGGVSLTCSGTGTPAASGTLTKVSGTGDGTIAFSSRTITGQPTVATVTQNNVVRWRRVGGVAEIFFNYQHSSNAGTNAGSGDYLFLLPTGLLASSSFCTPVNTLNGQIGNGTTGSGAASLPLVGCVFETGLYNDLFMNAMFNAADRFKIWGLENAGAASGNLGGSYVGINGAFCIYQFTIYVPIQGWLA